MTEDKRLKKIKTAKAIRDERYGRIRDLKESSPCSDCGLYYPAICMDFDHRPGELKYRTLSKMGTYSLKSILEEIAKCDIVCSNCHRIRTFNRM